MAKYSENRARNLDAKYVYKAWSKIDSRIQLPNSLTGEALLPLLDNLPERKPVRRNRNIHFSPHFSWKSSLMYASAFILIVALSTWLGRGLPRSNFVDGVVDGVVDPVVSAPTSEAVLPAQRERSAPAQTASAPAQPEAAAPVPAAETASAAAALPDVAAYAENGASPQAQSGGIGGQNKSVLLGQSGAYTYTYRQNDQTDPSKAGYPITVNIVHTSSGALAFSMDLSNIEKIDHYAVFENSVVFVGPGVQGETALCAYDLALVGEPREMGSLALPGNLLQCRLTGNVLHLFTFAATGAGVSCEVVSLPQSTADSLCVVTALDVSSMQIKQLAFSGASENVSLKSRSASIDYPGNVTDANNQGEYAAHIDLDGMNIALRSDDSSALSSQAN